MTNFYDNFENTDNFRFLKFPHSLFTFSQYADMTNDAKLLYALMRDRTNLSLKNRWYDDQGKPTKFYVRKIM